MLVGDLTSRIPVLFSANSINILEHLVIKLVYLVFEKFSKLSAGKIDLILVLYFAVFQFVEEFDKGLDYFVE
jgi:hypothetical protein